MKKPTGILPKDDILGQALMHYYLNETEETLTVRTNKSEDEVYTLSYFFRDLRSMPILEKEALKLVYGRVLDVGAGTGIHSLALQKLGFDVMALEISHLCNCIMQGRGVKNVRCANFFKLTHERFDTLLFLMNGIGLVEKFRNFNYFFKKCRQLLNPGGQIIFDSSDIIYLFEEEDGSFLIELDDKYYGEVEFQVEFQGKKSKTFPWIFIDFDNFQDLAQQNGFKAELIMQGGHYDYLAKATLID